MFRTNEIKSAIARLLRSNLARNTMSMMAGGGVRLLLQAAYFVLIARSLGPGQYGAFVGAAALIAILAPFSTLGTGNILIQNVARNHRTFSESWGNALCVTGFSGAALLALVLVLSRFVLSDKAPFSLILFVGLSDLLLARLVDLAGQAFQAFEMLTGTAATGIILTASRAGAALVLVAVMRHPSATSWAILYSLSSAVAAVFTISLASRRFGRPGLALHRLRSDVSEGFYFSVGVSSQTLYNDVDKTMLVRLATLSAAGIYATAYRVIDLAFQPIGALQYSTYARFFQHGSDGIEGSNRFARRLLPFAAAYSLCAGLLLFFLAPTLRVILGRDYGESVEALRWLAPLVLLRATHYFLSNCLTGAGFQKLRSGIQVFIAGFNIALNLWLIPAYSWRGAAWASLASDGLLGILFWAAIAILLKRAKVSEVASAIQSQTTA